MPVKTETYLTTLTPLRGIAALLVVIFHCNIMFKKWLPDGYTNFVMSGWLWVDFFFVLSGFIMSFVYNKYFLEKFTWKDYKRFIGARFARVYPLYFVTIIWAFLSAAIIVHKATNLNPFIAQVFNLKSLPACLILIQSLHIYTIVPLNPPSWSLSTEWWVYIIYPLIVALFARQRKTGKIVMLLLVTGFYIFLRYVIGPVSAGIPSGQATINFATDWGVLRCLAGFLLGMCSFEIYREKTGFALFKNSWCFMLCLLITIACMHFAVMDLLIIFTFPFVILTAAHNTTSVKRLLDKRFLQRLGDWSYSIYLTHIPIIFFFFIYNVYHDPTIYEGMPKQILPPDYKLGVLYCLVIVAATITVSSLTYRFIEVPARNYFNKVFETKAKKVSAVSLEV